MVLFSFIEDHSDTYNIIILRLSDKDEVMKSLEKLQLDYTINQCT